MIQGDGEPVKLVDRLATINGAVHTVYGHYAVYQGDYETIPVNDPLEIAEKLCIPLLCALHCTQYGLKILS